MINPKEITDYYGINLKEVFSAKNRLEIKNEKASIIINSSLDFKEKRYVASVLLGEFLKSKKENDIVLQYEDCSDTAHKYAISLLVPEIDFYKLSLNQLTTQEISKQRQVPVEHIDRNKDKNLFLFR